MPSTPSSSRSSLVRALRHGEVVFVDTFEDPDTADSDLLREQLRLFQRLGARHAVVAPLIARTRPVGAFTLVRVDRPDPFSESDIRLIEGVARRTALAVDNSRLFEQANRTAVAFQRSLLPSLPQPDGVRLSARYVPASAGSEVGGDWYDAWVGGDGVTNLVIGDVVGHDQHASVRMAELRNLLRGCAWHAPPSAAVVLHRLDEAVTGLDIPVLASVLFARLEEDESGHRLRWANAGHLPPLVFGGGGSAHYLTGDSGVLIGVATGDRYVDAVDRLAPGTRILLYTDGLVEHRGDLDEGLSRLLAAASSLAAADLEECCDALIDEFARTGDDDVAILVAEVPARQTGPAL